MAATTALQPGGYPGRVYAAFAPKSPASGDGPHNPGRLTELWAYGGPGGRHSFTAKGEQQEESVGSLRRIKSYRRYVARKSREAKRVEKKIARLEARRERIVEAAPSQPEALPTLRPLLEQLSALRSALSAIEANVSFARAQIEAAEDDEDEMLLLM